MGTARNMGTPFVIYEDGGTFFQPEDQSRSAYILEHVEDILHDFEYAFRVLKTKSFKPGIAMSRKHMLKSTFDPNGSHTTVQHWDVYGKAMELARKYSITVLTEEDPMGDILRRFRHDEATCTPGVDLESFNLKAGAFPCNAFVVATAQRVQMTFEVRRAINLNDYASGAMVAYPFLKGVHAHGPCCPYKLALPSVMMSYPRPDRIAADRQVDQLLNMDDVARHEVVAPGYIKVRTMKHDDLRLYLDYVDVDSARGRGSDERPKPHREDQVPFPPSSWIVEQMGSALSMEPTPRIHLTPDGLGAFSLRRYHPDLRLDDDLPEQFAFALDEIGDVPTVYVAVSADAKLRSMLKTVL